MKQNFQPAISSLERYLEKWKLRIPKSTGLSMLEFAPTCTITTGKTRGQKVNLEKAPYSKRIFELLDPSHPCQILANMWSSQSMKSVAAQIAMAYYTVEEPREILCVSSDEKMVKKVMDRRYTPMVQALGVRFISSYLSKGNKKTGDTTLSKDFPGGNIDATTANSRAGLASETKGFAVLDEIVLYGNGNFEKQSEAYADAYARLKTYMEEKKMLVVSTPGDDGLCMMQTVFEWGTQEEWWVQCPLCGDYQCLEVQNKDGYGLDWRTKSGRIIESSIVYVCSKCSESWTEKKKFDVQQTGEWRQPDGVEPIDNYTYSTHLHSINSNFEQWINIAKAFELGRDSEAERKSYDNHVAGMPHKNKGLKVEAAAIMKNRGEYPTRTVPDGVCYLTGGGDVQKGADRWQDLTEEELQAEIVRKTAKGELYDSRFPRIEIEIMGSGPSYRTWSIDYQVFYGHVTNAYSGAFEQLYEYFAKIQEKNGGFGFKREHDGMFFPIVKFLLDSGHNSTVVYQFTTRFVSNIFPCKGDRQLDIVKNSKNPALQEKNMQLHPSNFIPYKKSQVGPGGSITLFTISTKMYKRDLYNYFNIRRIPGAIQLGNFQDFPRSYNQRYFEMLAAEEELKNGEYDNRGRPNEALDCRVYSMCAADIYLNEQVEAWRAWSKQEHKWNDKQLETINRRSVIEATAKKMKIDERFLITKRDAA
jgi:phage terminase large subunit GpA-like protein